MQSLSPKVVFVLVVAFLAMGILLKRFRTIFLLSAFLSLGHIIWIYTAPILENLVQGGSDSPLLGTVVNRFGLVGYLALFLVWNAVRRPAISTLSIGDFRAHIRFPAIWKGKKETTASFLVIFCTIFIIAAVIAAVAAKPSFVVICYGVLFSIVNATLEEILWRGSILPRLAGITTEPIALITSAVAFGLYHLSLGFPIWACLIFAVGGVYMGGITLTSRGLLPSIIMHFTVNMLFVASGLIF